MSETYGARLERGEIVRAEAGGCIVRSLEREGIESGVLPAFGGASYDAGDRVLFYLFRDGTGMILAGM